VQGNGADPEMVETVALIRPELRRLLWSYRIPADAAADVMRRALVGAVVHWRDIRDKGQWLLETVQFECRVYWQERGQPPPAPRRYAPPAARDVLEDPRLGVSVDLDLLRAMLPAHRRRVVFSHGGAVARLREVMASRPPAPWPPVD